MSKKVSIVLVGISGYGNKYVNQLFVNNHENAYLKAAVDINPKRSKFYQQLIDENIPIYESLQAFYQVSDADLVIISTPIHLHVEQSCYAMNHGSHVLCEKPMTASKQDIQSMIETRDTTGKFLAIGFNWSFTPGIQQLKQDILAGIFGRPKRMKSFVLWPRNQDYYNRTSWAGKKYSPNGDSIFDSVANNATAHFLHNLFYLAGESTETSASIKQVTAETYRVNQLETFDTCAVNVQTFENVDILYVASHAIKELHQPQFELDFEYATIRHQQNDQIIATFHDGSQKVYPSPQEHYYNKLDVCIDAVKNNHKQICCGPEAASTHVICIDAIHQSVPEAPVFPNTLIQYDEDERLYWVEGLADTLVKSYQSWCLPSDLDINWSQRGRTIHLNKPFTT